MSGIDADSCRAVTTAALGDVNKVKFVPTTTQNRFTALQSGEVDLLSRSTTWTLGREGNLGLEFAWVNYYDGTGFMVKKSSGVKSAKEWMAPRSALRLAHDGTGDQRLLPAQQHEVHADPDPGPVRIAGGVPVRPVRCLFDRRLGTGNFPLQPGRKAQDLVLLPEIISKEPLGVMVRKGDDKWFDLVRWTFIAMITAEEKGITSQNIDSFMDSKDPDIRRLARARGRHGQGARGRQQMGLQRHQAGRQFRRDVGSQYHADGRAARHQ